MLEHILFLTFDENFRILIIAREWATGQVSGSGSEDSSPTFLQSGHLSCTLRFF